jgi:hypothetical protein
LFLQVLGLTGGILPVFRLTVLRSFILILNLNCSGRDGLRWEIHNTHNSIGEAIAIAAELGAVPVTAPKAAFGHLGAGGGVVELMASVLGLAAGVVVVTASDKAIVVLLACRRRVSRTNRQACTIK